MSDGTCADCNQRTCVCVTNPYAVPLPRPRRPWWRRAMCALRMHPYDAVSLEAHNAYRCRACGRTWGATS